jgi:hypothetical protein
LRICNGDSVVTFLFIINAITSNFIYEGYCISKCDLVWSGNWQTFQSNLPSPPPDERWSTPVRNCDTPVPQYHSTLPYIPADSSIYSTYRNNLKFHVPSVFPSLNRTVINKDKSELCTGVRRQVQ